MFTQKNNSIFIGVVIDIAGIAFYWLVFVGRANHAGTIVMAERLDAGLGASAFTLSLRETLPEQFPECFANVGSVRYEPGASQFVSERAIMSLEFRSAFPAQFERLKTAVVEQAVREAWHFGLGLELQFLGKRDPVVTCSVARNAIGWAARGLDLRTTDMISRAGHDAQVMASLCPVGMFLSLPWEGLAIA